MTTPLIPDFIFSLYQQEVIGIVSKVVKCIAEKFTIEEDKLKTVVQKNVGLTLEIVDDTKEKIRIIRCKPRKVLEENARCIARVKTTEGSYGRCKFKFMDGCMHCKRHSNKPSKYGNCDDGNDDQYQAVPKIVRRVRKIY
jgi:hypothetical protein